LEAIKRKLNTFIDNIIDSFSEDIYTRPPEDISTYTISTEGSPLQPLLSENISKRKQLSFYIPNFFFLLRKLLYFILQFIHLFILSVRSSCASRFACKIHLKMVVY
jgi:hypothetical protein